MKFNALAGGDVPAPGGRLVAKNLGERISARPRRRKCWNAGAAIADNASNHRRDQRYEREQRHHPARALRDRALSWGS